MADLIDAATSEAREEVYVGDAHKNWRSNHRELVETMKGIAAHELQYRGYTLIYDTSDPYHYRLVGVEPPKPSGS